MPLTNREQVAQVVHCVQLDQQVTGKVLYSITLMQLSLCALPAQQKACWESRECLSGIVGNA